MTDDRAQVDERTDAAARRSAVWSQATSVGGPASNPASTSALTGAGFSGVTVTTAEWGDSFTRDRDAERHQTDSPVGARAEDETPPEAVVADA